MGLVSFLMGFLFVLAIKIIFALISSGQIVLFDDTVSVYSVVKDIVSLMFTIFGFSLTIFGLVIAWKWKDQILFTQRNKVAIELFQETVEFQTSFERWFTEIINFSNNVKRTIDAIPRMASLADQKSIGVESINKMLKDTQIDTATKFLGYWNLRLMQIKDDFRKLDSKTKESFILRNGEIPNINTRIRTIIDEYLFYNSLCQNSVSFNKENIHDWIVSSNLITSHQLKEHVSKESLLKQSMR